MKLVKNTIIPNEKIINKILLLRNVRVIIDKDIAELYQVKPIALRQQVKRNQKRFPLDFMFQLSMKEVEFLVSQSVIPSKRSLGGYLPYAFTEHGVAMLASVLNSDRAVDVNIQIIRGFIQLRTILNSNEELRLKIEHLEKMYDKKFAIVFEALRRLMEDDKKSNKLIGFQVTK